MMVSPLKWMNGTTMTLDAEIKIVEKTENGKKMYGVRYKDGHVKWFDSLPDARFAYATAKRKGKRPKW